jgi:hypothetical protein
MASAVHYYWVCVYLYMHPIVPMRVPVVQGPWLVQAILLLKWAIIEEIKCLKSTYYAFSTFMTYTRCYNDL